jgi:3-oxoacyl-ACP reductase-like protein
MIPILKPQEIPRFLNENLATHELAVTPSILLNMKEQYLQGKVAIVTGASRTNGIGAATAYSLAEHGANVSDQMART